MGWVSSSAVGFVAAPLSLLMAVRRIRRAFAIELLLLAPRRVVAILLATCAALAACSSEGPADIVELQGSADEALSKPNGTNGDDDYCTAAVPCISGEGDCDDNSQCSGTGVICVNDIGPKFNQAVGNDVCAPSHCTNGVKDVPSGETGIDCGGPCGRCSSACTGAAGGNSFCLGCSCSSGQGDCDSDLDCAPGLVCAADFGLKFGFGAATDVCVPAHCYNDVQDVELGESAIDCGGTCGACSVACTGVPGANGFCSACVCTAGQGDCDAERECAPGLTCLDDHGPRFGWAAVTDVCLASHCGNDVQDAGLGETGIDCGGPCGPCLPLCSGAAGGDAFCVNCRCSAGQGDCDYDRQCAPGLACTPNVGATYGFSRDTDVCTPRPCTSGVDCPAVTYTLTIPKPTTVALTDLAILGKEVILGAGVRVFAVSTEVPARVAATSSAGLVLGAGAEVGGVQSAGAITLGSDAKVGNILEANSAISSAESAWWGGSRISAPDAVQTELTNTQVTWPDASGGALSVTAGQVSAPAPGRYEAVTVPANATLQLASGAYYFDSLTLLPGSALVYANLTGPVRIFLRRGLTYRGTETRTADRANILIASFGTDPIDIGSPFRGTIWAPDADITLAAAAAGHRGSFVGDRIEIPPNTPILHEPYVTRQCTGDECGDFMPSQCQAGSDFIRTHPITVEQSAANSPYWGWYASFNVLENAQDWVCFLTRVGGDLGSVSQSRNPRYGARYVGGKVLGATVEKKNDYWVGSVGYDVSAEATCVHRSCFSNNAIHNTGPYWVAAEAMNGIPIIEGCEADTQAKPAGLFDEATFLTKFDPWEPSGGGERGWVVQHPNSTAEIKASDHQCDSSSANDQRERVQTEAHAFRAGPLNLPALFDGPNATSSTIDQAGKFSISTEGPERNSKKLWLAPVRTSVCYLSSISGQFAGGGEFATITIESNPDEGEEYWQLFAQHLAGGEPNGVQAEATCYARDQDRCQTAEASELPECQPLVKQSFTWSQDQAPREMGSTADRACMLTEVRGDFAGGAEEIRIHVVNGSWVMDGKSKQAGLRGKAQCVSTTSFTDEQSWTQGQERVLLGTAEGRACFLTRITGHYEGGGERLRVYIEDGNWYLHGQSQQLGVGGSARCIPAESVTAPVDWNQGDEPITLTDDPADARDVCFLTMVKGRFEGGGESVAVTSVPGASGGLVQQLGGHSEQDMVGATAMCARLPRSLKVGSPEAPPSVERDCTLVPTGVDFYGVPDEQDRVCFMVSGAGYEGDYMDASYACRPRSCYLGSDPHDLTAQLPTIVEKEGEDPNCADSTRVPLTGFDSVGYLFDLTGNFAGFGEKVWIDQATTADTFSEFVVNTCQDYVGGAARTLTLGTGGQAIKFMGAGDAVGTLGDVGGFEVDTTLGENSVIMTPFDTTTCVVTSVSGEFNGGGERFELSKEDDGGVERWKLSAQKLSGHGIRVGARCFLNIQNP